MFGRSSVGKKMPAIAGRACLLNRRHSAVGVGSSASRELGHWGPVTNTSPVVVQRWKAVAGSLLKSFSRMHHAQRPNR